MSSKAIVNQRFIDSVNWLVSLKSYGNKSQIAEKLAIKPAKFSEILNNRMSVQIEDLSVFCSEFPVNATWLLTGEEEMAKVVQESAVSDTKPIYGDPLSTSRIIELQQELIFSQKKIIELEELLRGKANAS